ncbi:MAG: hypothetical protein ACK4FK_14665 [Ferrovibrio sp.]
MAERRHHHFSWRGSAIMIIGASTIHGAIIILGAAIKRGSVGETRIVWRQDAG